MRLTRAFDRRSLRRRPCASAELTYCKTAPIERYWSCFLKPAQSYNILIAITLLSQLVRFGLRRAEMNPQPIGKCHYGIGPQPSSQ